MSHFTVLTVVEPDLLAKHVQKLHKTYGPALESGDPSVMETGEELEQATLYIQAQEEEQLEEIFEYVAVQDAIRELLIPYKEYDGEEYLKKYLTFEDCTEETQEESAEVIEADSYTGKEHPDFVGKTMADLYLSQWGEETHRTDMEKEVLYRGYPKDKLDDITGFDLVAITYRGLHYEMRDGEKRYGYYHNPNGNWDWYQIGGRWSGSLPVKEEGQGFQGSNGLFTQKPEDPKDVDIARIRELNFDYFEEQTRGRIEEFWKEYQPYMETGEEQTNNPFAGVHHQLVDMGIEVLNADEYSEAVQHNRKINEYQKRLRWFRMSKEEAEELPRWQQDDRSKFLSEFEGTGQELLQEAEVEEAEVPRRQYNKELTKEDLETEYRWYFEWGTYAALDNDGWHSKGEMGWWGMSTDNAEDRENWSKSFFDKFIRSRDPDSYVAVVDCHI